MGTEKMSAERLGLSTEKMTTER